ncbi:MAG: hypothetical protein ACE5FJ_01030, partial [Gemmatimonadales bacterium]
QDMTKQFIEDCAFWAKYYNLAASEVEEIVLRDEDRDVKIFQITFDSGNIIQALPSTPRNLRSKGAPGERVVIDEFGFVDDPDELLKAAMAFLMWGGQVRIISTHNGAENAFNTLIEDCRKGRKPYRLHKTTFMEAVAAGLFQRICLMRGEAFTVVKEAAWIEEVYAFYGDDADEELDCIPSQSAGRYLPRIIVEQCTREDIPVVRLKLTDEFATLPDLARETQTEDWCNDFLRPLLDTLDSDLKSCYGMDFARSGDLSVLIPAQEERSLVRRSAFVLEMRNVPFEQQRQILYYIVDRLPRFSAGAMDATGNGAYLAERAAQRYGFMRIHQIKLNSAWYLENMPKYKAALEDRKIELPADSDVVDDHGDVVRKNGVPLVPANKTRLGSDGGQRHGDSAIAGVLLWFASLNAGAAIEYQSAGERETSSAMTAFGESRARRIEQSRGFGVVTGGLRMNGYT